MRLLFVSDMQSSTETWIKAIENSVRQNIDILILAGDHTGKYLAPIVEKGENWESKVDGKEYIFHSKNEIQQFMQRMGKRGMYTKVMSQPEIDRMRDDPSYFNQVFESIIIKHMRNLLALLKESNLPENTRVLISPGNDDPYCLDDVLFKSQKEHICIGRENIVHIHGYSIVNFEYSSPTPWNTPRELSEEEIYKRIKNLLDIQKLSTNTVFNFHCPPYGTLIDRAPKLDKTLKPVIKGGRIKFDNVGSKSIRRLIEDYQPICSLHGHVHESPGRINIGKTVCFNPGSEYERGIFRGYLIEISNGKIVDSWIMSN